MKGVESSTIPALLSEIRVDDISALPSGVTDFQSFAYCIDYFILIKPGQMYMCTHSSIVVQWKKH